MTPLESKFTTFAEDVRRWQGTVDERLKGIDEKLEIAISNRKKINSLQRWRSATMAVVAFILILLGYMEFISKKIGLVK